MSSTRNYKVTDAEAAEMVRDRAHGASLSTLADLYDRPRPTVQSVLTRAEAEAGFSYRRSDPFRSGAVAPGGGGPAGGGNTSSLDEESQPMRVASFGLPAGAPLGLRDQGKKKLLPPPARVPVSGDRAAYLFARSLDELVSVILAAGGCRRHGALCCCSRRRPPRWRPVRISSSLPDEELIDWPARMDLLRREYAVATAVAGWRPIEALERLLDIVGAGWAAVSTDISREGRPHFYGDIVVPSHLSDRDIDDHWSTLTGAREGGALHKRVRSLDHWRAAVESPGDERVRALLRRDVEWTMSYMLKGGDRPLRFQMPATLPRSITDRPALSWLACARGVALDLGADLGAGLLYRGAGSTDVLAAVDSGSAQLVSGRARVGSVLPALAGVESVGARACAGERARRERHCWECDRLLPPVRHASDSSLVADLDRRRPVRAPRVDRRYCSDHCRASANARSAVRERVRVLAALWVRQMLRTSPVGRPRSQFVTH
jgi:hypothetical protein